MGMLDFGFGTKKKKKSTMASVKSQIKKVAKKLELKAAKKKLEELKGKL